MTMKDAYSTLTGADQDDVRSGEARNGVVHVVALTLTKTADALIDPKLVLSWLLTALAAPGAMIGLLVPVREAGALLPQLALARRVEASRQRKRFWALGSAVQGIAALCIAGAALLLSGAVAGAVIVGCLAVLAVARSAASVSYKDALARTIAKRRRGAITGLAASVASVSVFGVGLMMVSGLFEVAVAPLAGIIALAGAAFLLASVIFMSLRQELTRIYTLADLVVLASLLLAPLLTENLAFLRVLRALRLLHSYRLLRDLRRESLLFRQHEDAILAAVNLFVFIFVTTSFVFVLAFDETAGVAGYIDALYFTVATLTTTGFGDVTMTTPAGKLLAVFIMVVGVALFVQLARAIFQPSKITYKCPECGLNRHEPDAIHCKHCGEPLKIETEGGTA